MVVSAQLNDRPGLPNHVARSATARVRARAARDSVRRSPRPGVEPLRPERRGSSLASRQFMSIRVPMRDPSGPVQEGSR